MLNTTYTRTAALKSRDFATRNFAKIGIHVDLVIRNTMAILLVSEVVQ